MVTIVDVANEAGVSVATVSRVLNGSYAVTQEKIDLVLEAVEKTGYVIPSRMKIANETTKKTTILVITNVFLDFMIDAVHDTAKDLGYQTVEYGYRHPRDFEVLKELINNLNPILAGIILINAVDQSKEFQALLSPYPLVQIGEPLLDSGDNYIVYSDEIALGYDATKYLIDTGHKNIGIISPEPNAAKLFYQQKRVKGYTLALLESGIEVDYEKRIYADLTIEGGYDATVKLLEKYPDMDAIVCSCDSFAMGCIYALQTLDYKQNIQPFSLDYNELWEMRKPFSPYINPHHDSIGAAAMEFLASIISKESITICHRIIPHELVLHPSRKN